MSELCDPVNRSRQEVLRSAVLGNGHQERVDLGALRGQLGILFGLPLGLGRRLSGRGGVSLSGFALQALLLLLGLRALASVGGCVALQGSQRALSARLGQPGQLSNTKIRQAPILICDLRSAIWLQNVRALPNKQLLAQSIDSEFRVNPSNKGDSKSDAGLTVG